MLRLYADLDYTRFFAYFNFFPPSAYNRGKSVYNPAHFCQKRGQPGTPRGKSDSFTKLLYNVPSNTKKSSKAKSLGKALFRLRPFFNRVKNVIQYDSMWFNMIQCGSIWSSWCSKEASWSPNSKNISLSQSD